MKICSRLLLQVTLLFTPLGLVLAEDTPAKTPTEIFAAALQKIASVIEPPAGTEPQTFSPRLEMLHADGLAKDLAGRSATLAFQAPDRFTLSAEYKDKTYSAGRDQQQLWIYVPDKQFGVVGKPGQPRFASAPEKKDATKLGPVKLPLPKEQIALLPLLMNVQAQPDETLDHVSCQ